MHQFAWSMCHGSSSTPCHVSPHETQTQQSPDKGKTQKIYNFLTCTEKCNLCFPSATSYLSLTKALMVKTSQGLHYRTIVLFCYMIHPRITHHSSQTHTCSELKMTNSHWKVVATAGTHGLAARRPKSQVKPISGRSTSILLRTFLQDRKKSTITFHLCSRF